MKCRPILRMLILLVLWLLMPGGVPAQECNPTVFIHAYLIPMTSETVLQDNNVRPNSLGVSEKPGECRIWSGFEKAKKSIKSQPTV